MGEGQTFHCGIRLKGWRGLQIMVLGFADDGGFQRRGEALSRIRQAVGILASILACTERRQTRLLAGLSVLVLLLLICPRSQYDSLAPSPDPMGTQALSPGPGAMLERCMIGGWLIIAIIMLP